MNRILHLITRNSRLLDFEVFDRLELQPLLPAWAVFLFAVLAVGGVFTLYRRETGIGRGQRIALTILRSAAYLALLFILVA